MFAKPLDGRKINGSHKLKISDRDLFKWDYNTWGSHYWVKLELKSRSTSSEAVLTVVRNL